MCLITFYFSASEEGRIEHFAERTRSNWNFSPVCKHDVLILVSGTSSKKVKIFNFTKQSKN